jgi:hypothetical protein
MSERPTDPDVALAFEVVAHLEDYDGDYPNAEKLRGSLNRLAARLAEAEREREALREAAQRFVSAYEGNKAGRLGNGRARQSLNEFRAILAADEAAQTEEGT